MKKRYMFAVLFLVFAAGCSNNDTGQTQTAKIVKTQSVAQESVSTGYDYIGVIKAKDTKNYSFLMAGKISEICVEKGQEFKKGDVLAKLDATTLQYSSNINNNSTAQAQATLDKTIDTYDTNITNAQNNINTLQTSIEAGEKGISALETALVATQTNLDAAKDSLDTAYSQLEAARAVNAVGGIADLELEALEKEYNAKVAEYEASQAKFEGSKAELEKSRAELESLRTQKTNAEKTLQNLKVSKSKDVAAAQAVVDSSKQSGNITNKNINDTVITADADGYVMELPFEVGEVTSAGYPVVVAKSKELIVTVGASDKEYSNIKLGQKAVINGNIGGTVTTIAQYPDESTRTYAVDISIPDADYTIGETVNVKIVTGDTAGCYVPINSIINIDGVDYVYVVNSENKIHRKQVTLGDILGDKVQIQIDDPTAVVVTEGVKNLRENDTVQMEG